MHGYVAYAAPIVGSSEFANVLKQYRWMIEDFPTKESPIKTVLKANVGFYSVIGEKLKVHKY